MWFWKLRSNLASAKAFFDLNPPAALTRRCQTPAHRPSSLRISNPTSKRRSFLFRFPPKYLITLLSSYVQDPKWQRKFSIIWPSVLAFFVLASLPRVIRAIKKRRAFTGVFGVWEDLDGGSTRVYESVGDTPAGGRRKKRWRVENFLSAVGSVAYWSIPGLGLNVAQSLCFLVIALCHPRCSDRFFIFSRTRNWVFGNCDTMYGPPSSPSEQLESPRSAFVSFTPVSPSLAYLFHLNVQVSSR
jgi:hypothetical protein